jgi:hypothetical protein
LGQVRQVELGSTSRLENRAPATGPITCTFLAKPPSLLTRGLRHAATGRVKCGADPDCSLR